MPASVAGNAHRQFISWASRCTALAIRKATFEPIREQVEYLNQMLRGHHAYYGIAGNFRALQRVHRAVERYWRKMLSSRSWKGAIWWKPFHRITERYPL